MTGGYAAATSVGCRDSRAVVDYHRGYHRPGGRPGVHHRPGGIDRHHASGSHRRWYSNRSFCNSRGGLGFFAHTTYPSWVVVQPQTVYVETPVETVVETYVQEPVYDSIVDVQPTYDPLLAEASTFTVPSFEQEVPPSVTTLPSGETPSQESVLAPLMEGDAAFAAGDYAQARRHYIRAQLDGVYVGEATLAYALSRFAEGEYALAAMAYRRGLELQPDAIDQPLDVLHFYGQPEALRDHLDGLDAYLKTYPTDRQGWFLLGQVRYGAGDLTGALTAFDRALALNPGDVMASMLREATIAALEASERHPAGQDAPSPGPNAPVNPIPAPTETDRSAQMETSELDDPLPLPPPELL
ncbi:MAG: tetratricopeptide repeat protein [bacterium]|nr:tetratricopeptide repeat protein [bacterium]